MNIDQRLEALTQSVELLASFHRDSEKRAGQINGANERRFDQIARNFELVLDSIKRLENVAMAHEQRLDDLEGGS